MSKNYLLLNNNLGNLKKSSKVIFFDDYSKFLIDKTILKKYRTSSLLTFNELKKFNYNSNLLNKKIKFDLISLFFNKLCSVIVINFCLLFS